MAKRCTVYLFLPVPVISDCPEEDNFLLLCCNYLQNLAWTIMRIFMACSVNHVYVQADAHFFVCAAEFSVCFAYAILITGKSSNFVTRPPVTRCHLCILMHNDRGPPSSWISATHINELPFPRGCWDSLICIERTQVKSLSSRVKLSTPLLFWAFLFY